MPKWIYLERGVKPDTNVPLFDIYIEGKTPYVPHSAVILRLEYHEAITLCAIHNADIDALESEIAKLRESEPIKTKALRSENKCYRGVIESYKSQLAAANATLDKLREALSKLDDTNDVEVICALDTILHPAQTETPNADNHE